MPDRPQHRAELIVGQQFRPEPAHFVPDDQLRPSATASGGTGTPNSLRARAVREAGVPTVIDAPARSLDTGAQAHPAHGPPITADGHLSISVSDPFASISALALQEPRRPRRTARAIEWGTTLSTPETPRPR